jgi:hypothetical protein
MSEEDKQKRIAYGVQWVNAQKAGDKAGMDAAHKAAEALRSKYGYSGGSDGSGYNPIQAPTPTVPDNTAPTVPDNTAHIQSIYQNINDAQTASLNAARDQANSDYDAQIKGTPEQFQPLRDQVDLGTVRNVQRANEVAAAKGTTFSGGVQSDVGATYASGEGQKTALNQQEANVVASLKKAIADNNRATSFKQIEMTAQNNAQMQQSLLAEKDKIFDRTYQVGRDQVTDAYNLAGLTGYYNGDRTLAGQQMDTSNQQWEKTFNAGLEQWSKQFDYQVGRDTKLDAQWEKSFLADQANAAAGRAIQWAGVKLDREKFEDSKKEMVDAAPGLSEHGKEIYKNALDMISATLKASDDMLNVVDKNKYTPAEVFNFIDQSSLSEEEKLSIIERIPGL